MGDKKNKEFYIDFDWTNDDWIDAFVYGISRIYHKDAVTTDEYRKNPKMIADYGEVIFQDKNTILKIGNETYIAKPEKGEVFDKEKGILVCLVKALGLTTTDVIKLLNNSKTKTSKNTKNEADTIKSNKKIK